VQESIDQTVNQTVTETVDLVIGLLSTWGLQVIGAIALLIVGRWIAGRLRATATRSLERSRVDDTLVPFLSGMVYYLAIAVVLIAVLNLFGVQTASLIAVLGAAGLAVGLALQGTLSNFSAGVMLLLFRPFKKDDYVIAGGVGGTVIEIALFTTTLHTPDNVQIIVPNSSIFGGIITNYSANATRRNDLVVGISYTDDIGKAMDTIRRVLGEDERVLADPEPVIFVSGLGDSSVDIGVRPWCNAADYWALRWDLTRRLKEELESAGCTIPFPQRDLHIVSAPTANA